MARTNPFEFLQQVRTEVAKVTWPTRRETVVTTITSTMMVVITVSLRVGQVTLETSVRTCCRNSNGFVLAILFLVRSNSTAAPASPPAKCWQEWRDSNPQPPVLETGALAS